MIAKSDDIQVGREIWRPVTQFSELGLQKKYMVSHLGRVASYDDDPRNMRILRGSTVEGYRILRILSKYPKPKSLGFLFHRLIADAFCEKPDDTYEFVIHLDFDKLNNRASNLRWATKEQVEAHGNLNPAVLAERGKVRFGKSHQGHKLTSTEVLRIKKMLQNPSRKTRMKLIAKQFGISEMQLYRIKTGENWSHINP